MTQRPRTGGAARASAKGAARPVPGVDPSVDPVDAKGSEAEMSADPVTFKGLDGVGPVDELPTEIVEAATEPATATSDAVAQPPATLVEAVTEVATPDVAPPDAVLALTAAATKPTKPNPMQGIVKMMKTTEELFAFGQANVEAFVKSGQIWAAGVQELTKQMASCAKESFDESVSTFKAMTAAKSVKEALDLQSSYAKTAFEKAMAESNKLTDASIKLTEDAIAPITARMSVAVETFGKAV